MLLAILIVFFPLIGSMLGLIRHDSGKIISSLLVGVSALLSWWLFFSLQESVVTVDIIPWVKVGSFEVNWGLYVDSLTSLMFIVVTTVSAVVHFYSIGYMHDDPHNPRFFSYISLFTFFMLMLVSSNNFIQLFFGWEGVGLCSYLLIGFWFKKESANKAAMKAFVVNRVGDFGLALGIALIYFLFDSVNFAHVFSNALVYQDHTIGGMHTLTIITLLLFLGCMGKSAQIGLHTWLPDAMEGPTPVSALIHAATMVTAGVFLVVRCSPLFELTELTRNFIVVIGSLTCFMAAIIAIFQNDIKKIIAYSTCSQLGYMFIACGLSAYGIAMFHLATHAFFKSLLFLCAGNVIHVMSGEQNINSMSSQLWKKIPITYSLMWVGSLALAGIFPLAGFYSKDLIIEIAHESSFAFTVGMIVVILTSFYSWRLIIKVFHSSNLNFNSFDVHESPKIMTIPLSLLAFFSITSGFAGKYFLHITGEDFWYNVLPAITIPHLSFFQQNLPLIFSISGIFMVYLMKNILFDDEFLMIMFIVIIFSLITLLLGWHSLIFTIPIFAVIFFANHFFFLLIHHKYYFDELYNVIFIQGMKSSSRLLWKYIDICLIDKTGVEGIANVIRRSAGRLVSLQTGLIFDYTLSILLSILALVGIFIYQYVINSPENFWFF